MGTWRMMSSKISETREIMARFHGLPDKVLAHEILLMARDARKMIAELDKPTVPPIDLGTYNHSFLWNAIPEVARRLGETNFQSDECSDNGFRTRVGPDFRYWVGSCIKNNDLLHRYSRKIDPPENNVVYLLDHEPCNGNPVAMALDRVCPPDDDSEDYIASSVREIGRRRFGYETVINSWSPKFQDYEWFSRLSQGC